MTPLNSLADKFFSKIHHKQPSNAQKLHLHFGPQYCDVQ